MSAVALALSLASRSEAALGQQRRLGPLTREDLERFADSTFGRYVRESAEPSLAVVVVRGDSVLFAKGYGRARDAIPVSVDTTVFHLASLSKLFVVTAVMQQVERGRLGLDAPVATMLPELSIPSQVTLRHLLTHTSGIDSPFLADVVDEASALQSLPRYFTTHPPHFGRPPGLEIRYSNYGMTLAALLVERASGEPFDAYVKRHIFAPLGMHRSSIRQPPPPALWHDMATAGSGRVPDFLLPYPAGAIVSTPADMGRFIRGLIGAGNDSAAVLSAQSLAEIERRQWAAHPAIPGVGLGFFETDMGGVHALFHTGARTHFSLMYLLPEQGVGVFIVHSMRQGGPFQSLRTDFARGFVNRYFASGAADPPRSSSARPGASIEGTYRPVLFSASTVERAAWLFADTRVKANADGSLDVHLPAGPVLHLLPREGVFRVVEGEQVGLAMAFDDPADVRGRMFLSGATQDPISFDRLAWYQHGALHLTLFATALAVMAGYSVITLAAVAWRAARKQPWRTSTMAERRASRTVLMSSVVLATGPLGMLAMLAVSSDSGGPRWAIAAGTTLLVIAAAIGLASVPIAVIAWRRSYWTRGRRAYVTAFAVCSVVLSAIALYYHLGPFWM